jgi:hypothetical protein
MRERPAGHLDRAPSGPCRGSIEQVADERMSGCAVGDARRMIVSAMPGRRSRGGPGARSGGSAGVRAYVMDVDRFEAASSSSDRLRP